MRGDPAFSKDMPDEVVDGRLASWEEVVNVGPVDCDARRSVTFHLDFVDAFIASATVRLVHMAVGGVTGYTSPGPSGLFIVAFCSEARARAASQLGGWTLRLADSVDDPAC